MPKVVSYTPAWLSRPSPGSTIFSDPSPQSPPPLGKRTSYLDPAFGSTTPQYQGHTKLIAQRGTEIFAVVGNKIRWADLAEVKQKAEDAPFRSKKNSHTNSGVENVDDRSVYRTLTSPVYYQIRQLIISPSGNFLAICTEHTVHIAVPPESARLRDGERSPLKLKTYQLGATTHVIPESPIVSALWHPLAVRSTSRDCLVTVTSEAAVRVWELDRANQWSFEKPALAIDLRRLADGVSSDEDFEPSGFGKSRGFSVDAFDMEVSAACFGGSGMPEEDPWASMTLWTAMRNGDIYALCPLLPSKWVPCPTTLSLLSTTAVSNAVILGDTDGELESHEMSLQQYAWIKELDATEPAEQNGDGQWDHDQVLWRPTNPGVIPKLQGPFGIPLPDLAADVEVSDIQVVAATVDPSEIEDDEMGGAPERPHLMPYTLIYLATTDKVVHVLLEIEGVAGQWLPRRTSNKFIVPDSEARDLVLLETVNAVTDDAMSSKQSWPMLIPDPASAYDMFLTTDNQIISIGMSDWLSQFVAEISPAEEATAGFATRLEGLCQTEAANTYSIIHVNVEADWPGGRLTMPAVFNDINIGYMLLSSTASQAYAACFDEPDMDMNDPVMTAFDVTSLAVPENDGEKIGAQVGVPRPIFEVPGALTQPPLALQQMVIKNTPARIQHALKRPLKLSPAILEAMTATHRLIAPHSSHVEQSAAELFRRCDRLHEELQEHIRQMAQLADRLQQIGDEAEDGNVNQHVNDRLTHAIDRQARLAKRYEELRRKAGRINEPKRDLSSKEVAWAEEIALLGRKFGMDVESWRGSEEPHSSTVDTRTQTILHLGAGLLDQARELGTSKSTVTTEAASEDDPGFRRSKSMASSRLQRDRATEVKTMVDREGTVIEAVMSRLKRLTVDL